MKLLIFIWVVGGLCAMAAALYLLHKLLKAKGPENCGTGCDTCENLYEKTKEKGYYCTTRSRSFDTPPEFCSLYVKRKKR